MAEAHFLQQHAPKLAVALLLTFASGLVDIVGYIRVFHFFTAHMTGTTVQIGYGLVNREWRDVLAGAVIVAAFVCGSLFGRALIEIGSRRRIRRIASLTLTAEVLLLLCLAAEPSNFATTPYGPIAILAGAMGIQTATLTGIGPLTVHTTFVTGMLNKIAQLVSHMLFRSYDLKKMHSTDGVTWKDQRRDIEMALFLTAVWFCYVAGAVFGTLSQRMWGLRALFVAILLLILSLAADRLWPLSVNEEKEQSER